MLKLKNNNFTIVMTVNFAVITLHYPLPMDWIHDFVSYIVFNIDLNTIGSLNLGTKVANASSALVRPQILLTQW